MSQTGRQPLNCSDSSVAGFQLNHRKCLGSSKLGDFIKRNLDRFVRHPMTSGFPMFWNEEHWSFMLAVWARANLHKGSLFGSHYDLQSLYFCYRVHKCVSLNFDNRLCFCLAILLCFSLQCHATVMILFSSLKLARYSKKWT